MSGSSFKENIMSELQQKIKATLLETVPALGSTESGTLDWKNGETEEIAERQSKLLIDKCDFITVNRFHSVPRRDTIIIKFEKIILRGSRTNRFWDIYLTLDKASSRYPQLNFYTLKPEFHDMDDDENKYKVGNFINALHPHISSRAACFGEFESPIMALLSNFNYAGAVMIVRKFLDTWNRNSAFWDMNTHSSSRFMHIIGNKNKEYFDELSFAEKVYLKRQVYDSYSHGDMLGFEKLVAFTAKMKQDDKRGIDWTCLRHFYSLLNYVENFGNVYLRSHEDLANINELFKRPRRSGFIWYEVSADVITRKRLMWFDGTIGDFKQRLKGALISEVTPKMLSDYSHLFTVDLYRDSPARDVWENTMKNKLQIYSDVRYKRVKSEFIKSLVKMTKLPSALKDRYCTKENVNNLFNIDFLSQLIDEAKMQCCKIALRRTQTKERKLRNEIATLRGDALQAELFSEEVPRQGVERPSVVQPQS